MVVGLMESWVDGRESDGVVGLMGLWVDGRGFDKVMRIGGDGSGCCCLWWLQVDLAIMGSMF